MKPENIVLPSQVSPTGQPRLSPRKVPLFLAVAIGAAAGFTLAGQMLPEAQYPLARIVCTVLGVAVGTFAGVISPGSRK